MNSNVLNSQLTESRRSLRALSRYVGSADKVEAGQALAHNVEQLVALALNRQSTWVSSGKEVCKHDPDIAGAVRAYELLWRVIQEVPPQEPLGDSDVWRQVCRRAAADPVYRAEMVRALEADSA